MNETIIYPEDEQVGYADEPCPNCGHETFSRTCWDCGGDGCRDGYEEDPLWYDPGDMIPCDTCGGHGCLHWCPRCGWDMMLPPKWNTPRHRGMAIALYDPRLAFKI